MQINLRAPGLKEFFKYLGWPLFFGLLWLNGCSGEPKTVQVKTPEVKAVFEAKKPDHKPEEWPEKDQPNPVIKWKEKEIPIENPVNIKLAEQYIMAKDSIERLKLYIKSIQLNKFSTKFEDENLLLNINGIVQGEIQEMTPSYTIKSKEVSVQVADKETYLRIFIGTGLGVNTELNRGLYKFDIDFMNRKGDIFSGEYLRVNGQDFGVIGIKKSIINLRR